MADFERLIQPFRTVFPDMPSPYVSFSDGGKADSRTAESIGRTWEEAYTLDNNSDLTREFLSYINYLWNTATIFTIVHKDLAVPKGTISNTPTINGANQTGNSITVTALTGTLLRGDVLNLPGINQVFDVTADVSNGATSIPIHPTILTGGSPINGGSITHTNVKFRCLLDKKPIMPERNLSYAYIGLTLYFRETP